MLCKDDPTIIKCIDAYDYGDDEDYYSNDEYLDDYQPLVLSDDEPDDVVVF